MVQLSGSAGTWTTSSSLAWKSLGSDGSIPRDAIYVGHEESGGGMDGGPVWCRGQWRNNWIAGEHSFGSKECTIAFLGKVINVPDFDVLVSVGGAARIKLISWDRQMAKPLKSLMTPNSLLCISYDGENGTVHTGNLGTKHIDRTANMYGRNLEKAYKAHKVLVLVEDEPTKYTLTDIQLDIPLDTTDNYVQELSTNLLTNEGEQSELVSSAAEYKITQKEYWGRARGTIVGLPTMIFEQNREQVELSWGIEAEFDKLDISSLRKHLPKGTAVNATIMAKMEHYEVPYLASIRAFYDDGYTKTWRINSFHTHDRVVTVIAQFGSSFFLSNGSVVPTVSPSSQLLYQTTTTTTTTSTIPTTTPTSTTTEKPTSLLTIVEYPAPGQIQLGPQVGSLSKDVEGTSNYDDIRMEENVAASTSSSSSSHRGVSSLSTTLLKALAGVFTPFVFQAFLQPLHPSIRSVIRCKSFTNSVSL